MLLNTECRVFTTLLVSCSASPRDRQRSLHPSVSGRHCKIDSNCARYQGRPLGQLVWARFASLARLRRREIGSSCAGLVGFRNFEPSREAVSLPSGKSFPWLPRVAKGTWFSHTNGPRESRKVFRGVEGRIRSFTRAGRCLCRQGETFHAPSG